MHGKAARRCRREDQEVREEKLEHLQVPLFLLIKPPFALNALSNEKLLGSEEFSFHFLICEKGSRWLRRAGGPAHSAPGGLRLLHRYGFGRA